MSPFEVIVADPPWQFSDKLTMSKVKRGADAQYRGVLDLDAITDLLLTRPELVADDAVCYLWVPSSMIEDGIHVLRAWGFTPSGTVSWTKTTKDGKGLAFGMGHLFRQCHEICLEGRKGKIVSKCENKSQRSSHLAPNAKHSQKPENLQDSLDLMFPKGRKLEMFARRQRPGWECLGNEIPFRTGDDYLDIRDTLDVLQYEVAGPVKVGNNKDEEKRTPPLKDPARVVEGLGRLSWDEECVWYSAGGGDLGFRRVTAMRRKEKKG